MSYVDFSNLSDLDLPGEQARLVARDIRERYPSLRLVRLRPGDPDFDTRRPFAVVDLDPLTPHRVLRTFPESLLNQRGLAEIIDIRSRQWGGMTKDRYWALKEAEKALRDRRRAEEQAARRDVVASFLRSPLHRFRYHDDESGDTIVIRK